MTDPCPDLEGVPNPDEICLPTIEDLDALREHYGFSKNEFSRLAGVGDEDRWAEIIREGRQPRLDTYRAFVDALRDADPDGPRTQRGRESAIRTDGGRHV